MQHLKFAINIDRANRVDSNQANFFYVIVFIAPQTNGKKKAKHCSTRVY